jgi:hypothetical protein
VFDAFSAKKRQKQVDDAEQKALNLKKQKAKAEALRKKKKSVSKKVDDDFWGS